MCADNKQEGYEVKRDYALGRIEGIIIDGIEDPRVN
jgi:hypothetical protein